MNLILLFNKDYIAPNRVVLKDFRKEHITTVLKSKVGETLCVGLCDGLMGEGCVICISDDEIVLDISLTQKPPNALPVTLIMPLPRPHVLKRTLQCAASLGIKKIFILNFNRVEKSLWNSSALKPAAIREQLILGLQQAKDTLMPEVMIKRSFKAFVEKELASLIQGTIPLLAHPGSPSTCPKDLEKPITLLIGPEGGIIDHELHMLSGIGFKTIDLGPRILKVESVLPYLIGALAQ